MKNEQAVKAAFEYAAERYAAIGVDVNEVLKKMQGISLSLHCWQTDDVSGFENNRLKEEKISKNKKVLEKLLVEIKKYINTNLYDEEQKCYVRNTEDKEMDISLIGTVVPFNVFLRTFPINHSLHGIYVHFALPCFLFLL